MDARSAALGSGDETARGASAAETPREPAAQVLLVDNSPMNAAVARRMLERLSCSVDVARDGSEAVSVVEGRAYDLVLLDCSMPMMDGFEATTGIHAGSRAGVVIVAMTADVAPEDRARCMAVGMNDFLPKPVRAAALDETLECWVPATSVAA